MPRGLRRIRIAVMSDCLFCKIVSGDIPASKVAETDTLFAFEDINPVAPAHILIVPKKHLGSCLDIREEDAELIGRVHMLAARIARERGIDASGFRVVTNTGPDAGQAVFHIHFHLIGGRGMAWPPG